MPYSFKGFWRYLGRLKYLVHVPTPPPGKPPVGVGEVPEKIPGRGAKTGEDGLGRGVTAWNSKVSSIAELREIERMMDKMASAFNEEFIEGEKGIWMGSFKFTTDMELQGEAVRTGREYVEKMFPSLEDLEKRAWLQNAAAAGYMRGYRKACEELVALEEENETPLK